jgi:hypothetical protein
VAATVFPDAQRLRGLSVSVFEILPDLPSGIRHRHTVSAHRGYVDVIAPDSGRFEREFAQWASWLNQVELWFAKIQRDVIARGVFTSVADLGNKLRKYIRAYSQSAKPFRWTYTDPSRRIIPNKITGTSY